MVLTDEDAWVRRAVRAGELHGGWARGASTANLELEAGHVELGTADAARHVEGYAKRTKLAFMPTIQKQTQTDDLSAKKVLARSDVGGEVEGEVATIVVEHLRGPVVRVVRRQTHLGDLEPARGGTDGRGCIVDFRKVDVDGAVVVTAYGLVRARAVGWLLVHLHRERVAGCYRSSFRCCREFVRTE